VSASGQQDAPARLYASGRSLIVEPPLGCRGAIASSAPIPAARANTIDRLKSTHSGPPAAPEATPINAPLQPV